MTSAGRGSFGGLMAAGGIVLAGLALSGACVVEGLRPWGVEELSLPEGGRVLSRGESSPDKASLSTVLELEGSDAALVVLRSERGFKAEWDGRGPFDLGELPAGRYESEVTPLTTGISLGTSSFEVEAGKSCRFGFDVGRGDWMGGCEEEAVAAVVSGTGSESTQDMVEPAGPAPEVEPAQVSEAAPPMAPAPRPAPPAASKSSYPMKRIPSGTYTIGCTSGQSDCRDEEKPPQAVRLSRAFYIGESEVTQGLYEEVMFRNLSHFKGCGPTCPVENVSWFDAVRFANALSVREGFPECYRISGNSVSWPSGFACGGYRLPTESEWEVAARGGSDLLYAGSDELSAVAWHFGDSDHRTHPVCGKGRNGYGLCDMSGNVWEWTWDWYGSYPGGTVTDPLGPPSGSRRVTRGGGWRSSSQYLRVAERAIAPPNARSSHLGFRLVRSVP
ncbi:MAG: hypothetical protein EA397_01320 [Deltaproteobacteria bacterium]|nr:MAG: hypothetical protein EA397_01320 [Deltaproteobacteria bacterium]